MFLSPPLVLKIVGLIWGLRKKSRAILIITIISLVTAILSIKILGPNNEVENVSEEIIKYFDDVDLNLDELEK